MTDNLTAQDIAGRRANYQKRLAIEWIREHRPDIWEKIWSAAYAEFPNPNGYRKRHNQSAVPLPKGFKSKQWK